ncbi:phenylalanine--tRNA ligase subunit beta, partial [Candidatus Saccharibacteria bacterium]|nr:phenylalanine--tRNA ligase subunit beta [Candidatus Saccharibacteria bacterium]
MRISLNWLKKFVKIKVPDADLVRLIGARLVEVEGVIDETHKYDKIYVVKVESAEKIPDTHLTLCQIDVGNVEVTGVEKNAEGLIQVVCGAPNVREGMLTAWIAPGATVPASVNEDAPFVIGKRKMLGKYESNGMLAGADELDFGDDHSGIVEIDPDEAKAGDRLADVYELDDLILDIENKSLTHRPDTFGMIGFAREVAGILGEKFEGGLASTVLPVIGQKNTIVAGAGSGIKGQLGPGSKNQAAISIEIQDKGICPRYTAVVLEKHGEMKKKYLTWMDTILAKSGMRPVDPVVDATNFMMLLTGQPLHAFDYDKFVAAGGEEKPKVVVRLARAGEKLTLLDGKEVELVPTDIVIASHETPVALAGAMGGASTAISEETRKIILESATFSLYNLRKTQMEHGIFSEAITRFTKGQPAYQTLAVAEACAGMLGGGFKISEVADKDLSNHKEIKILIDVDEINGLLGTNYSEKQIMKTLANVGFEMKKKWNMLEILAPEWRTDIHIKEDIIEEVGRLNGYDNIKPVLPTHGTASRNKMLELKSEVREILKSFGANEVLTYSFVSAKLMEKAGLDIKDSYRIVNSISPELQLIRQSIVPSLLDKAYMNQKIPFDKFAIFEINKVYHKGWGMDEEGVPMEAMRLGLVIAERKNTETAYYKAKYFVEKMLRALNIAAEFRALKFDGAEAKPFEGKRAAEIWAGETMLGVVGEFKNSVKRNFKLADYLAGFELDFDAVLGVAEPTKKIGKFELKDKQDITVTTKKS